MKFTQEHIQQLNLLLQFDLSSRATGIKVHNSADSDVKDAVSQLFEKGLCTQHDGGYLTDEGIVLAEHAEKLLHVLARDTACV